MTVNDKYFSPVFILFCRIYIKIFHYIVKRIAISIGSKYFPFRLLTPKSFIMRKIRNLKIYLTLGVICILLGLLGLVISLNFILISSILIAMGIIGVLRFLIKSNQIFWSLVIIITLLLLFSWLTILYFSPSVATTSTSIESIG